MDELRGVLGLARDSLPFNSLVGFQNYPLDEAGAFAGSGLTLAESGDVTLPDMPLNLMVERHAGGLSLQLMFARNLHGMPEAALRLDMMAETLSAMPDSADIAVEAIAALPAILMTPRFNNASPAASISHPAPPT